MNKYIEYKEIDERNVKGRKVDIHSRYVKYKLYKAIKMIEKEGILKPFVVMRRGTNYYVKSDNIRFIAAKMLGFEKIPCLIIDTSERKSYLEKHFKKSNLKDEKSETRTYRKVFNDCKRKYITLDI